MMGTLEQLCEHLRKYVLWLSYRRQTNSVMLGQDDLADDLWEEVIKGWLYYKDKGLQDEQLLAVIRQMLDNRVGELVHRYHGTHREAGNTYVDLDDVQSVDLDALDPQDAVEQDQHVRQFLESLEPHEMEVVCAILYPDARMGQAVGLASIRRGFVFDNPAISVGPDLMSSVLHIDLKEVKRRWHIIRRKWRECTC
jgi:DNA-directed RNA polymerase specialized sigma24 family protein